MSKIALYRKYRPTNFDQVIGQNLIVSTLQSELIHNNIYHAYIFAGTRGSGKTSLARILAKAVNCEQLSNGNPCNHCGNCQDIINSSCFDIQEIDAASNSGVEEIRQLVETVNYLPAKLHKKVYIIDEAHMLSNSAWNALLKTIEDPPQHVIFIFATTEINKIPMTIMSRCQRFDFHNLQINDLISLIDDVCSKENILISNEAKIKISQIADGSARDCLSILHQVSEYSENNITIEKVNLIFGLLSLDFQINFLNTLLETNNLVGMLHDITTKTNNYLALANDFVNILLDKIIFEKTQDINLMKVLSISNVHKIKIDLSIAFDLLDDFIELYQKIKLYGNGEHYFKMFLLQMQHKDKTRILKSESKTPQESISESKPTQPNNLEVNNQPKIVNCFSTKEIKFTSDLVDDSHQDVLTSANNTEPKPINSTSANNFINNTKKYFQQIIHNASTKIKNELNKKLETIKTTLNNESNPFLKLLLNCSKVIVASKHGAVLLFTFKNNIKQFNQEFWDKQNYNVIKNALFDNGDMVLLALDKNTIQTWKNEYNSLNLENTNIADIDLSILNQYKMLSDDEKRKEILAILNKNQGE